MYRHIFEATPGTQYTKIIAPFKCSGNGRGTYLTLKDQFAVPACWNQYIKYTRKFLVNRKCKRDRVSSLQAFLNQHCTSYSMLQCCTEHVQHQFPDMRQRVKWIIDNIYCEDSSVRAAISSIIMDGAPDGLRNDSKIAVAFLFPTYMAPKKIK